MLGLQGTSSSSKVYRCMACSSTFTGLASLLVHQATHAAAISSAPLPPALPAKPPQHHHLHHQDPLLAHRESSQHHHQPLPSSAIVLFESPSDSLYICDCGDEFKDFNLMLEHKRVHLSNPHLLQPRATNDVRAAGGMGDPAAPPLREPPGSGGARPVSAPTPPAPHRSGDPRPVSAPTPPAPQRSGDPRPVSAPTPPATHRSGDPRPVSAPTPPATHRSGDPRPVSAPTPPATHRSGDPRPVSAPAPPAPQRHALAAADLQSVSSSDTRTVLDAGAEEDAAAPRERSQSPRRPPHEESNNSSAVQEPTPEAIQDMLEPVPDISEAIQHMSDAIQEMSEAIQDRPKPVQEMSEAIQDRPKPVQEMSEAIQDRPDPVQEMSEAIQDRPDPVQEMPEAIQDRPKPVQQMSEAIQDRPDPVQEMSEAIQDRPKPVQEMSEAMQEDVPSCNDRTDSVPSSSSVSKGDHLPKNNNFMKLLATAYMRRFPRVPPPEAVPDKKPLVPKAELVPVEITQEEAASEAAEAAATAPPPPLNADDPSSVSQLRQLLKKPKGTKTKSPGVGRILDSSTKSIVSLTKSFSPVVLLETRQTLVDPTGHGGGVAPGGGAYQCCRCRRVFRDVDALTEHHSMHRKERIKCCRHCKKLIIGKMPFPDNHVCPQLSGKQPSYPKTLLAPHAKTAFAHLRLQNQKRVFFCPTCKHSYARRYNLKMHKCRVSAAPPHRGGTPPAAAHQKQTRLTSIQNGNNRVNNRVPGVAEMPILGISKSVGTEMGGGRVKVEPPSSEFSDSLWSGGTAKGFPPFFPQAGNPPAAAADADPSQSAGSLLPDADKLPWDGQDGGGQWTVPLDEELEALSESDLAEMEDDVEELAADDDDDDEDDGGGGGLENSPANAPLPFFVSNGVKRYPCGRCQKTYSRQSTLRRHLMLCGTRQAGLGLPAAAPGLGPVPVQHFFGAVPPRHDASKAQQQQQQQQHMFGTVAPNKVNKVKPMFDCYVCGKSFNRKDNMLVHRNKCELNRTVTAESGGSGGGNRTVTGREGSGGGREGSGGGTVTGREGSGGGGQKEDGGDGNNWGIMSLPSVLPRRVTCECGMGFTSPRLLLEHLQKHAQENYTCPTCGETVGSWADYEVHLQIHMHPHHQLYPGGLQPRRSQPLLLRFQQQPSSSSSPRPHPPPPPAAAAPPKQQHHRPPLPPLMKSPAMPRPAAVQHQSANNKSKQRFTCTRCNNTFSSRCSLRRHVSLNRCKGSARLATNHQHHQQPKTNHCTRCNAHFPSTIALVFHQRSGACCKPPSGGGNKPMRCHVCARWFGSPEGLQRHMLSHSNHHRQTQGGGGGGGPLPYRCDVCDGSYPNLKSLKNHRRRVHRIMAGDVMAAARPKLERLLVAESV